MRWKFAAAFAAALVLAGVMLFASGEPTGATTDATGTWNIQLSGSLNLSCNPSYVKQHGTFIAIVLPCLPFGGVAGSIDKATGNVTASATPLCKGFPVTFDMSGNVSASGSTMSGTWSTLCIQNLSGTFAGSRTGPLPPGFPAIPTPTATDTATATSTETPAPTATPTTTSTATPVPPTATPRPPTPVEVGGISRDAFGSAAPAARGGDGGSRSELPTIVIVASAVGLALGGAAWHARRRVGR